MVFSAGTAIFQIFSLVYLLGGLAILFIIVSSLVSIRRTNQKIVDQLDTITKILQDNSRRP